MTPTIVPATPSAPAATPAAKYVPCSKLLVIDYAAQNPDGSTPETAANDYDTVLTIAPVRKNNAVIEELCGHG